MIENNYNAPNVDSVILSGSTEVYQPVTNLIYFNEPSNNVWFNEISNPELLDLENDFHKVENNNVFHRDDGVDIQVITATGFEYDQAISLSGNNIALYEGDLVDDIDHVVIEYSTSGTVWNTLSGSTSVDNLFSISGSTFYLGTDDGNYNNNLVANVRWYDVGDELIEFFPMNERASGRLYGVVNSIYMAVEVDPIWVDRETEDDTLATASIRSPFIGGQFDTGSLSGVYVPTRLFNVSGDVYNWSTVDIFGNQISPAEFDKREAFETLLEYACELRDDLSMDTYHSLESSLSAYPSLNPDSELTPTNSSIFEIVEDDPITCYFSAVSGAVDTFTFVSNTDSVIMTPSILNTTLTTVIGGSLQAYYIEMDDINKGKFNITYDNNYTPPPNTSFIIEVDTNSLFGDLTLPLVTGNNYNFTVDWGDGSSVETVTAWDDVNTSHTYTVDDVYEITIDGVMSVWQTNTQASMNTVLRKVLNFGDTGLTTCSEMFEGSTWLSHVSGSSNFAGITDFSLMMSNCPELVSVSCESWNLSDAVDVSEMWAYSTFLGVLQPDVSNWGVSNVQIFTSMYDAAIGFDPDVTLWETGAGIYFGEMFQLTDVATPNVTDWDMANATVIGDMFSYSDVATPNVTGWVTSSVEDASWMFDTALLANPDVSGWDMTNAVNVDGMFYDAISMTTTVPDTQFWNRIPAYSAGEFDDCFSGAVNITNYGSIPPSWL
jgi:hypothetical protein